jgi:probable HAF family extracellular repeat protein
MNFGLDSIDRANRRARNAAKLFAAAVVVASLLVAFSARAATSTYDITNLGLGGNNTTVSGINASGQVVGYGSDATNSTIHALVATRAGGVVDIGTLGGQNSFGLAINASGQVVGYSDTSNAADGHHAFSWTSTGGMVDLGTVGGKDYLPIAINDSGQVIGYWTTTGADSHAFSWTSAGGMVDLGTLGGTWTFPIAINNSGQVVGISRLPSDNISDTHAFMWTKADGMVDLGTLGGSFAQPWAINALGQVVGASYRADGATHAFLWSKGGGMLDLGTVGGTRSYGFAISDSGLVVGRAFTPGQLDRYAFAWTSAGGIVDLGSFGGSTTDAIEVNASGQVIGYSQTGTGELHPFSWTSAGGMVDLGTLGGKYAMAEANNVLGHIVGRSLLTGNAMEHAFLHDGTGLKDLNDLLTSKPAGLEVEVALLLSDNGSIVATSNAGYVLLSPSAPAPAAPVVGPITANDPVAVATPVSASASFTDVNAGDIHTADWMWGDGGSAQPGTVTESGGSGTAKGSHTFAAAGIYSVGLAVTDSTGLTSNVSSNVVVYDPSSGFVTGNGWIQSPPGAYKPDVSVAGRATFSFVSKYQKGAKVPVGTTAFQFQSANLDFYSDSYDWMVVAGARAQFKGTGTLDGAAGYRFMLTAIDGQVTGGGGKDRFRIKIWHYDSAAQQDVVDYDNQLDSSTEGTLSEGTVIGSGSIVIHTSNK